MLEVACARRTGAAAGGPSSFHRTTFVPDRPGSPICMDAHRGEPFGMRLAAYRIPAAAAEPSGALRRSADLFEVERRVLVQTAAPAFLRTALQRPGWRPRVLPMLGGVDPYAPIERSLRLTRGCLEVLAAFRNPVVVVTYSDLVTRDVDVLRELAADRAVRVFLSLATLRADLAGALQPGAAQPMHRLHAIHRLAEAGVPVGVMFAPVVEGLTDEEAPAVLRAAAGAGATLAGYMPLTRCDLPPARGAAGRARQAPDRKDRVAANLELAGSRGAGAPARRSGLRTLAPDARRFHERFRSACLDARLQACGAHGWEARGALSTRAFRKPCQAQQSLF